MTKEHIEFVLSGYGVPFTDALADKLLEMFDEEAASYQYTINKLNKVLSENKGEWISVTERLPEEDGQYIITVKYKHVDGYDDIYAEHGEWTDGRWDMFCFGHCGEVEDIIAWMPLPEPYKKGE